MMTTRSPRLNTPQKRPTSSRLSNPASTSGPLGFLMSRLPPASLGLRLAGVMCGLALGAATCADDFQTWQTVSLRWLDTQTVDLTTVLQTRFYNDSSDFSLGRIGQAVSSDPLPWLRVGVAYRYTEAKDSAGAWRHQHRGEFQVTPRYRLTDRVSVSLRNRFEWRTAQGANEVHEVLRMRLQLNVATPEWKAVRGFYVGNECFHSFDQEVIYENRVVPLGLRFPLHEKAVLRVFYLLRSVRGTDAWRHAHVLGTALRVAL